MSEVFPETPLSSPEVWSDAVAPGGYVCAAPDRLQPGGICGMPVESEPCARHSPPAAGAPVAIGGGMVAHCQVCADLPHSPHGAPAPELAAAMAETRTVRDGYRQLCGEFGPSAQSGWSARISLTVLNRHLRAAGLAELPRTAASGDREDVTMRYRRERDEARAVVAEMIAQQQESYPGKPPTAASSHLELQRDEARWQRDKLRERLGGDGG